MADYYLYDGEVTLRFDERRHTYSVRDSKLGEEFATVPSVTRVLSILSKGEALTQWASNSAIECVVGKLDPERLYEYEELVKIAEECKGAFKDKKRQAADIGTEAHGIIEGFLSSGGDRASLLQSEHPQVASCVDAAITWLEVSGFTPTHVERRVYSRKHRFSGTADAIGQIQDQKVLIDWKSSKGIYPEYELQTAAYASAYTEETGERIVARFLVRLGKDDGAFEVKELPTRKGLEEDFKAFKSLLTTYRWQQSRK